MDIAVMNTGARTQTKGWHLKMEEISLLQNSKKAKRGKAWRDSFSQGGLKFY